MQFNPTAPANSTDIQGVINAINQGIYPWWYPEQAIGLSIDPFDYAGEILPLAANSTGTSSIAVDGDSAFILFESLLWVTSTDNLITYANPPQLAQIKDSGSGRYLSNIALPVVSYFGTAQHPMRWATPRIWSPNSTISLTFTNLEATARNVRYAFRGIKIEDFKPTANS